MSVLNPDHGEMPVSNTPLRVYFDGACPLCRREISFYQRRKGADLISWVDVSRPGELHPALSKQAALARFHVANEHGELFSGARAFAVLWQHLPGFRLAGRMLDLPGIRQISNTLYDRFLILRPALQRWVSRRSNVVCDDNSCR